MFKGRNLLIATQHHKEKVIAPILENLLGVHCSLSQNFDTDELGTFSGEIERKEDPISTVRQKCLRAMELNKCDLAIASEGSFGPHPSFFSITADDEFLILLDKKNDLEILVRELSIETNFDAAEIRSEEELLAFAKKANFPSHALILKDAPFNFTQIIKGICSHEDLIKAWNILYSKNEKAFVETDMRALFNPSRMRVIEKATHQLAEKANSCCPNCGVPGFGVASTIPGLPCELCNYPTRSILAYVYKCEKCSFSQEQIYPKGKTTEDAMHCDLCNP
jgi:hypothetical protein